MSVDKFKHKDNSIWVGMLYMVTMVGLLFLIMHDRPSFEQSDLYDFYTLFLPVFLLSGLVLFMYVRRKDKQRAEGVSREMLILGFVQEDNSTTATVESLSNFDLFSPSDSGTISNLHRGKIDGQEIRLFEYTYTTGSGETTKAHRHSVILVKSHKLSLPPFTLTPESFIHKVMSKVGYQDIDFEGHDGFSDNYLLRGKEETKIRSFLNPTRLKFFEENPGLHVQGDADRVLFYTPYLIDARYIRDFISIGGKVIRSLSS